MGIDSPPRTAPGHHADADAEDEPVTVGDIVLDPARHTVTLAGAAVPLSGKEFALRHELMRQPGVVLSPTYLIDHVWDSAYEGGSNVVDVYVRHLREKVDRPFGRSSIQTVRGSGYRLVIDEA